MSSAVERLSAIEASLERIELAVVGNGSAGSSLRERVTALETNQAQQSGWRYRGVTTGATAIVSAALAYVAHALTLSSQH